MDDIPFLSDMDSSGKLVVILRLKKEAASKRMDFYRLRNRQNNAIISEDDKLDSENRSLFEFIHIEHVFAAIQSIESFHGALASARKLIFSDNENIDGVLSSLIVPHGINEIRSRLREHDILTPYLCQILAIPTPSDFPEPKSEVERLLRPTLKLVETMAVYSQKYWDVFKTVRHVYAHNYRFVFTDRLPKLRETEYLESVVGHLDAHSPSLMKTVYVGPLQRSVMIELSMQLTQIEQWVYQNMRDFVLNDWKSVLPMGLKYHSEKDKEDYLAIREYQEYDLDKTLTPIKFVLDFKKQLKLHESFNQAIYEVTGRKLIAIRDVDGF